MLLSAFSPKRAVIIAPHADDEVLGAGGLMAAAHRQGWELHVLFATVSGYPSTPRGDSSTTPARLAEVEKMAQLLGVASYEILFQGEANHLRLDSVPQLELIAFLSESIKRLCPSLVVMPCSGHYHQDHRAVASACISALRPIPNGAWPFVPGVLAYGHPLGGWGGSGYAFQPTIFMDISADIDVKLEAIACYESQLCQPPHPRSLEVIRQSCATWGAYGGVSYAEPFECLRLVFG